MKKGFKIAAAVLGLILLLGCTAFSAVTMLTVRAMVKQQEEEDENYEEYATSEDDVVISGEYTIRSTAAISDAYLSGASETLSAKDQETLTMASGILDEIITDGMTDYEKELAVYDWMVANLSYDPGALIVIPETGEDSDNPYGVLKYHNAVCVGYATTFRLFMQMLEIPCKVVHNSELYHSWDLVQLDGHWYHVDVYSDVGETGYAYFNLPDAVRMQQQNWDTTFFPAADSLTCNMCWQNRQHVNTACDVPAAVRRAMDDGVSAFALDFSDAFTDTDSALVQQILSAVDNALMNNYADDMPQSIREQNWMMTDEGTYCLLISFDRGSYEPPEPSEVDPEALEQADQALQEAFGDLFDVSIYGSGESPDYPYDDFYEWEGAKG